eukprot:CAMPEP_0179904604 /NCGR_PEP_ID=MMETSP0982-20121206/42013_1 /TAXON_ID=483367 /ORGANISM="non described non described, Strain CCMP 2436" /LENGTH=270 /DNA_ID=CAMNT_0021804483 /DNA_START=35 /DNA_END=845 /DNA_ORIENTATION=-
MASDNISVNTNGRFWWRSLTDVDPITLEPLKRLRYPPFPLRADAHVCTWFDGHVLGTYLISTGNFTHPLSRRELTREDCVQLDAYLELHNELPCPCSTVHGDGPAHRTTSALAHRITTAFAPLSLPSSCARRLGKPDVVLAYDNKEDYNKPPSRESRVAALQHAATDLLTALFATATQRTRDPEPSQPLDRAAADAARAVDPSQFYDEQHFPGLSEQAATAAAQAASGSWGGASPALTNGALRGPAARLNLTSADHFPALGGDGERPAPA